MSYNSYRNSSIENQNNRVSRWSFGHQSLSGSAALQAQAPTTSALNSIYKLDENVPVKPAGTESVVHPSQFSRAALNGNHRVQSVTSQ